MNVSRYFFHATDETQDSDDYNDEDEEIDVPVAPDEDGASSRTVSEDEGDSAPVPGPSVIKVESQRQSQLRESLKETQIDPSLAEWLMIDESQAPQKRKFPLEDDSETEPEPESDSDNEDVKNEDADVDDDGWLNVRDNRSATMDTEERMTQEVCGPCHLMIISVWYEFYNLERGLARSQDG